MTVSPEAIELLIERTDWVRELARRLVGDAHLADDVAQEATLAALRAAPQARRVGPAWLAGIVRNVAANMRRGGARRARHEQRNAKPGECPSAAQAAAFVEQQRLVADVVLQLEPAFRDVVLLRYFEELPRREIARRLDIPVATVNSRLARAMAKLRTQLDARHGGERSAWVAALMPLTLRAPIAEGLTLGALVMQKKVMAAAMIVALVGAGTWAAGGFATRAAEPPAVAPMAKASGAPLIASETRPATTAPVRAELAVPATVAGGPRLHVVDALTGAPEPDAEVRLLAPDPEPDIDSEIARRLRLGEADDLEMLFLIGERLPLDDSASLPLPTRRQAVVFARHGDRMGVFELRNRADDEPILRLWPLHTVRALVVDANGRAAPGVPVVLRVSLPGQVRPLNVQHTGGDGRAVLRWFESMREIGGGRGRLEAALGCPGGGAVAEAVDIEAKVTDVRLRCPPVGRVSVAVRASDGSTVEAPVMLMSAAADDPGFPWTKELADGLADFWPVGIGARLRASVWYGNRTFTTAGDGPTFAGEVVSLAIDVGQTITVFGRVLDHGQLRANVRMLGKLLGDDEQAYVPFETDAEGCFRTEFAVTARTTALELRERDGLNQDARVETSLPAYRSAQPIDLGDLDLASIPPLAAGTVVDGDGLPVARAQVHVLTRTDHSSSGWETQRIVTCDAQGRFMVSGELVVDEPWLQARRAGPWRHEPERCAAGARDLQLVLHRAGALAGQLRADAGVPIEHLTANLWDDSAGPPPFLDTRGWLLADVDAEGRFHFDGLRPGSYTLMLSLPGRRFEKPLATVTAIAVDEGEVSRDARLSPLDLSGVLRTLTLNVQDEDGRPLRADTFAILGVGQNRRPEACGWTDRPLLLTNDDTVGFIWVEADGYFAARVDLDTAEQDVVLRRGTPVTVQVHGAFALEAPFALRACLQPVTPTTTTEHARGYRKRFRPDHGFVTDGNTVLRVPEPGDYRLQLVVQRDDAGYLDAVDVTPESAPIVRVAVGGARLAVTVDATVIAAAVAKIGARKR